MTLTEKRDDRIYFPQVDGLRFLAFFLVLLHHSPDPRPFFASFEPLALLLYRFKQFGWIGVDVFLTLSSFLIFTLLLTEKERCGTLSPKSFYLRRALRIWPLYFPYLLFSMLLVPFVVGDTTGLQETIQHHLFPFLIFLGNFSYALHYETTNLSFAHLWTICLEEQFYLFAPLLVLHLGRLFTTRGIVVAMGLFIVTTSCRFYMLVDEIPYPMIWVNPICRFDPFIVGAICATLNRRATNLVQKLHPGILFLIAMLLWLLVACFPAIGVSWHSLWQPTATALGCGALILSVLHRGSLHAFFGLSVMRYLGKISFGLYVYHVICLGVAVRLLNIESVLGPSPAAWVLTVCAALMCNVAVSSFSYQFYEKLFLRLKARYERVLSRPV